MQNGHSTSLPASYQSIKIDFLKIDFLRAYPGDGIANNNTQYYMMTGSSTTQVPTYVRNVGAFGGSYVDTSPYPASGCSDSVTPGDCVTDAQIQAEVKKVMALKRWTGGLSHMFFVYTSSGEGSCSGTSCAYTQYCAYHGYFLSGSTPLVYANEPYAAAGYCQGGTSPNGNLAADSAASITSHELTEAITDPELNAWYSSTGQEIGDVCAWNYGSNTWLSGKANQYWPISYTGTNLFGTGFELQQEYNNHTGSCVQIGP